jgi:hypothetical protein
VTPNPIERTFGCTEAMIRLRAIVLLIVLATVATLCSTVVAGKVSAVQLGNPGCENDCDYLAAGWPYPYIVDGPGVSPIGSVDVLGVVMGVDSVFPSALAKTFAFWLGLLLASALAIRIYRRRNLPPPAG